MNNQTAFSAIVCEFNPLHYGHKLVLDSAVSYELPVVCVMSGNFVQRGEAAIIDKWTRTKLALENGADLVIELPLSWAVAGAERFAMGSIQLLNSLGANGNLLFGSEHGSVPKLSALADFLLSDILKEELPQHLRKGITFAAAREHVVSSHLGHAYAEVIRSPNNILAVEYIKAIKKSDAKLIPRTLHRSGAGHDQTANADEIASAQEIRKRMLIGKSISHLMPVSTFEAINVATHNGHCPVSLFALETAILSKLRQMSISDYAKLPDISEGLEYRLFDASRKACSLSEYHSFVKTKRYTHARIRRLALSAFLNIHDFTPGTPPYIRILGMTPSGERLLHTAKPSLPIVIRPNSVKSIGEKALSLFELEAAADDQYALAMPRPSPCGMDYKTPLIKLKR